MSTQTILNPSALAGSGTFDAAAYHSVVAFASGLAGAEVVNVMIGGGDVPVPAVNAAGTAALQLTAAAPSAVLAGGAMYIFNKGATLAAGGVYCAPALP